MRDSVHHPLWQRPCRQRQEQRQRQDIIMDTAPCLCEDGLGLLSPEVPLTSRVHLGQVVEGGAIGAIGLDQVSSEQGHGSDIVLLRRVLLFKDRQVKGHVTLTCSAPHICRGTGSWSPGADGSLQWVRGCLLSKTKPGPLSPDLILLVLFLTPNCACSPGSTPGSAKVTLGV